MSIVTIIKEFWRFTLNNLWRILLGALVCSLISIGGRYAIHHFLYRETDEAYRHLSQVYQQEPASFQMIVTMEDGSIFTTATIFDEYFSTPEMVKKVESQTGVKFAQWLEDEKALEMFKTNEFRGGLAGVRDQSSNVITLRFLVADKSEDNLKIAKAYCDLVEEESLPFLGTNKVTVIREPAQGEMIATDLVEEVPTEKTLTPYQSRNAKGNIVYGVLGFILGAMASFAILFLGRFFNKKIAYAFEYSWDLMDQHYIYDRHQSPGVLQGLIQSPHQLKRWVLAQTSNGVQTAELVSEVLPESAQLYHDLSQAQPEQILDEMVILIYANLTEKEWLKQQMALARLSAKRLKIIQII